MDNIAEIAVQCRLCGLYFCHQNPMSIFSSDVLSKLKDLTGLELHEEEHQPRHICSTCLNELKVSIKFKERILRSRQILVPTTEDTIDQDLESEISNKDKEGFSCNLEDSDDEMDTINVYNQKKTENLIEWNLPNLENPESTDVDHLCKNKYEASGSDQESDKSYITKSIFNQKRPRKLKLDNLENSESSDLDDILTYNSYESEDSKQDEQVEKFNNQNIKRSYKKRSSIPFGKLSKLTLLSKRNQKFQKNENFPPKAVPFPHKTEVTVKQKLEAEAVENISPAKKRARKTQSLDCKECGKSFKSTYNLRIHLVRHTGKKDFACIFCDRRFVSKLLLKLHVRVRHLGEQPFKCKFCPNTFFTSTAKYLHERRRHIRDWKYQCDECFKRFNTKTSLNKHKFLHTGKRPYCCDICNINFAERYTLKCHFKTKSHYNKATAILDSQHCLDMD